MIDQDQARKFWTNWVRREIGGSGMIQEAAVSAAVNELLLGHDNQAAADAARSTAHRLGGGLQQASATPSTSAPTPTAAPTPPRDAPPVPTAPAKAVTTGQAGQPLACRLCGSTPAANMSIYEHNGRLLWMEHKTNKGPFCRDCGTALLRHHQNSTLFQGWFGLFSFFITPITLLLNLGAWRKLRALGPPHRDPGVESQISAPLNPGKPLFRRPGPYVAGAVVAAVVIFFGVKSADTGGCLDSQTDLANRKAGLHNTYIRTVNRDAAAIDACTSVACERAPKLEIAAALRTFNGGLNGVCWPNTYKADAAALVQANSAMADSVTLWAGATTQDEDLSLAQAVTNLEARRRDADAALSRDLGLVPVGTPTPTQ